MGLFGLIYGLINSSILGSLGTCLFAKCLISFGGNKTQPKITTSLSFMLSVSGKESVPSKVVSYPTYST